MNARHKLNVANCLGSVLIAGLLGWLFSSWSVFLLASIVLVVAGIHAGDIRFKKTR